MKTTTCYWKGCDETITLDDSIEASNVGKSLGFTVIGYCTFHKAVNAKKRELFATLDKTKHHSEIANKLYLNDRKTYRKIEQKAIRLVLKSGVKQK